MDAEPILLPKICAVRSHFCASIRDAILSVDPLKRRGVRTRNKAACQNAANHRYPTAAAPQARLFVKRRWPPSRPVQSRSENALILESWLFSTPASPAMLRCCCMRTDAGAKGDWPKRLKAAKPSFSKGLRSTQTAGLSLAARFPEEKADVRKQEAASRNTFRARRSGT